MKKTIISPKREEKVRIEGVGTFDAAALRDQKVRKADLATHFEHLDPETAKAHHDTVWKAVSKGEFPDAEIDTNNAV